MASHLLERRQRDFSLIICRFLIVSRLHLPHKMLIWMPFVPIKPDNRRSIVTQYICDNEFFWRKFISNFLHQQITRLSAWFFSVSVLDLEFVCAKFSKISHLTVKRSDFADWFPSPRRIFNVCYDVIQNKKFFLRTTDGEEKATCLISSFYTENEANNQPEQVLNRKTPVFDATRTTAECSFKYGNLIHGK
jgi:hypothetical protein